MAGELIPLWKALHSERSHDCANCRFASLGYAKFGVELWFDCHDAFHRGLSHIGSFVCERHEYQTPMRFKGDSDDVLARVLSRGVMPESKTKGVLDKILEPMDALDLILEDS
jgi:hypothetical protein